MISTYGLHACVLLDNMATISISAFLSVTSAIYTEHLYLSFMLLPTLSLILIMVIIIVMSVISEIVP